MLEKAIIKVEGANDIQVMFNPTEYSTTLNAGWTESKDGKMPQYNGTSIGDLTINLFFDSYELGEDVRETKNGTKEIAKLALPTKKNRPPECIFSWGKFNFKGIIKTVTQKFTMFLPDGKPVRATLTITMSPVLTNKEILKLQGVSDSRKVRMIKEGDRLDLLAEQELKDPALWHKIAETNNIKDPLNFPSSEFIGKQIIIPHIEA